MLAPDRRPGWVETRTGPYRPYARGKGDAGEKMREKKRRPEAGGVRQRVGQGCGWRISRRAESRRGQRRAARREPC